MSMDVRNRRASLAGCALVLFLGGCSRQDTEGLARIGRKLLERAQANAEEISGKLELGWKCGRAEPGVVERVEQRLRADRFLEGETIEVLGTEAELQLRGTVKTAQQRERAIKLAESTIGVQRVAAETLQAQEP